jgi:DNA polymerase-3 subunit alpha
MQKYMLQTEPVLIKESTSDRKRTHLTLLARTDEGLHNLMKMVSLGYTQGFYYKPRVDKELLQKYGKGIIALSGCLGSRFDRLLLKGEEESRMLIKTIWIIC